MRSDAAVTALRELLEQSNALGQESRFIEWKSKVSGILRAVFGATSEQVRQFADATFVKNEGYTAARGRNHDMELWRQDAATRGRAVLNSAIYLLETVAEESPLDEASVDPELWEHVNGLVADNDWGKIPAAVSIFVEHKVRLWANDPRNSNGSAMVGKPLYATALNDSGPLKLGRQESESEGWRGLGTGLAQAIGNVDRHRIQQRSDIRRYSMGVLGLASLLLTQMRYEHPAQVQESEAIALETANPSSPEPPEAS